MAIVRDRPVLLLAAWTCIFLSAALIIINMFLTMTNPWIQKFWTDGDLKGWYVSQGSNFGLFPPALLYVFFSKEVLFTWTPLLFLALLSIWTRNRPFRTTDSKTDEYDITQILSRQQSSWSQFKHQVRLVFSYQLPPRKLWGYLLDGGFNVMDFIVVALWISMNVMWLYFSFYLDWPYLQTAYQTTGVYSNDTLMGDYCEALGYASAWAAVFNLVFVFIPISRSTFLQYLFNSDFSSIIRYHRWWGHGTLFMTLVHGLFFYIGWWSVSTKKFRDNTFAWQSVDANYLAGSLSFFPFGLLMWITTIPVIRRKFFKIFYGCHIIGFLGYIIFLEIHYPPSIWYMPGLVLYFMDVAFRLAQWRVTSGMQCTFVSADRTFVTIKLKFNKAAKVKTNQFVYLNCAKVAYFQWHPFSIAAAYPSEDGLTQDVIIHVKAYGSWSQGLVNALADNGTVPVRVDGPYGSASEPEWTQYDQIVMVAGGIGVTPLLGMLRDIQYAEKSASLANEKIGEHQSQAGLPQTVNLIWAVKNRDELQLLDQDLLATAAKPGSWLKLNLFHTKQSDAYVAEPGSNGQSKAAFVDNQYQAAPLPATHSLQPYGFGDFHWALAHFLAFVGGFFGCLMATAYNFEGLVTGDNEGEGKNIWGFGFLMLLGLIVGSMGLPALIIYPAQYFRYKKHVAACVRAHQAGHANGNGHANGHAKVNQAQVESLMPLTGAKSGAFDVESAEGKAATVGYGRPNLTRLITEFVAGLPSTQSIGVIASGPPTLVVDARQATHKASQIASKAGLRGVPELSFSNHSFAL